MLVFRCSSGIVNVSPYPWTSRSSCGWAHIKKLPSSHDVSTGAPAGRPDRTGSTQAPWAGGSFEVWENDRKLFDGPDNLPVAVGESRKITIKAKGYKDKTFTVSSDVKGRKFEFKLDRIPGVPIGPGSGSAKPPQVDPGCKNVVADPSSPACRKQYCQFHPDDLRCGAE